MPNDEILQPRALLIAADEFEDVRLRSLRSPSRGVRDLAEVLASPAIGGFEVVSLINGQSYAWLRGIEDFFAGSRPNQLLVLYISSHGIKDVYGNLHFAATTTVVDRIASTGVSGEFVARQIDQCRAQKVLLLLDCCYSGAFSQGHRAKAEGYVEFELHDRRGRAVITSSTALEYAFELAPGDPNITGSSAPSVFTAALIEGLQTGDADLDHDGQISLQDLYNYVYQQVNEISPRQRPEMKFSGSGEFIVALNPRFPQPHLPSKPPDNISDPLARPTSAADGQSSRNEASGEPDDDLIYWTRVVNAMRESADKSELASALRHKGVILVRLRFHDEAVTPYEESAAIYRDLGDHRGELAVLNSLADVYKELGQTDDYAAALHRVAELRRH